ncbi:protein kinase [Candidatus Poribacteria bacterium]|nr:protein kinase [Candidatus Poribacteria bacterium]
MQGQIGKYTILKEIGKGGMGVVYLARDSESGRKIALKTLLPESTRNLNYIDRFRREANAVSQLDHPHIVKVHEIGEEDGLHYFAMEYLAGPTLGSLLKQKGRFPPARAARVIIDIADALDLAHSRGIIHRDVKPDNIMADEDGVFKIMDFGIARIEEGTRLTMTGSVMGTPEYMSPEQASGTAIDRRTDIYSLGVVFYELLTGRLPFKGGTAMEVLHMHLTRAPESPKLLNPEIPGNLAHVVSKMLEKQPADRYDSFRHVINAISQAVPQNMRAELEAPTKIIEAKPARAGEGERPGPRVRERIVIETPARIRAVLAASIVINLALFGYIWLRPGGAPARGPASRPAFAINGRMFASPAISDDTLFLGAEDGTLYACELGTGRAKWTFKTNDKITAAPLVDGDAVYIGSWDGYVYALDAREGGRIIWKFDTGGCVFTAPALMDGTLYVCTREGTVFAIDAETGKAKWTDKTSGSASNGSAKLSPTLKDGVLFVPSGESRLVAYRAADGKRLTDLPTARMKTSAVVDGQKVYFVTFDDSAGRDELRVVEYEAGQSGPGFAWGLSRTNALQPEETSR